MAWEQEVASHWVKYMKYNKRARDRDARLYKIGPDSLLDCVLVDRMPHVNIEESKSEMERVLDVTSIDWNVITFLKNW